MGEGLRVEVMASFGIFLHIAILCFFTVSKVHAKHFPIETKDDVEEAMDGSIDVESSDSIKEEVKRHHGGKGSNSDGYGKGSGNNRRHCVLCETIHRRLSEPGHTHQQHQDDQHPAG